jgi:hypothetical protein
LKNQVRNSSILQTIYGRKIKVQGLKEAKIGDYFSTPAS